MDLQQQVDDVDLYCSVCICHIDHCGSIAKVEFDRWIGTLQCTGVCNDNSGCHYDNDDHHNSTDSDYGYNGFNDRSDNDQSKHNTTKWYRKILLFLSMKSEVMFIHHTNMWTVRCPICYYIVSGIDRLIGLVGLLINFATASSSWHESQLEFLHDWLFCASDSIDCRSRCSFFLLRSILCVIARHDCSNIKAPQSIL